MRVAAVLGFHTIAAGAPDAASSRTAHTAQCVAALKVDAEGLAAQIRAGREELKPALLARLEQGAAFIGNSYLEGHRDEEQAKAMLEAAEREQKSLSAAALAARQAACARQGTQMLAEASAFGRAVVSWVANNRMKKMLTPAGR